MYEKVFNLWGQKMLMENLPLKDQVGFYFWLELVFALLLLLCGFGSLLWVFFAFFHLIGLVWSACVSPFHLLLLLSLEAVEFLKEILHNWSHICHLCDVAEEDDAEDVPEFQVSGKIGAKKQRKLEEKQARKAQREVSISCHV